MREVEENGRRIHKRNRYEWKESRTKKWKRMEGKSIREIDTNGGRIHRVNRNEWKESL